MQCTQHPYYLSYTTRLNTKICILQYVLTLLNIHSTWLHTKTIFIPNSSANIVAFYYIIYRLSTSLKTKSHSSYKGSFTNYVVTKLAIFDPLPLQFFQHRVYLVNKLLGYHFPPPPTEITQFLVGLRLKTTICVNSHISNAQKHSDAHIMKY